MKVYIAGRITGDENYKAKFEAAKHYLESEFNFTVLNPAVMPEGMKPADYMRICFAMLDTADMVAFLPDYKESKGAMLEHAWCEYTERPCLYFEEVTKKAETANSAPRLAPARYRGCTTQSAEGANFVVHGKWIEDEGYYCCSKCGSAVEEKPPELPAECPCCGAKMEGAIDNA